MGLDVSYFRNHEELYYVRGHLELFCLIDASDAEIVYEGYDDFWLTDDMLDDAARKLDIMVQEEGLSAKYLAENAHLTVDTVDEKSASWAELLVCYVGFIAQLREDVFENGPLVCSYSA